MTFNEMPQLTEIDLKQIHLLECNGNTGLKSLFSRTSNLKKVKLYSISIDNTTASTFENMTKLEELELNGDIGAISTLLMAAAPNISSLVLNWIDKN